MHTNAETVAAAATNNGTGVPVSLSPEQREKPASRKADRPGERLKAVGRKITALALDILEQME